MSPGSGSPGAPAGLPPLEVFCDHQGVPGAAAYVEGNDYHCAECCPGGCELHPGFTNLQEMERALLHGASLHPPDYVALPVQLVPDAKRGIALVPASVGSPAAVVLHCTLALPAPSIRHTTVVGAGLGGGGRPLAGLAAILGRVLVRRDDLTAGGLDQLQRLEEDEGARARRQFRLEWEGDIARWIGPDGRRIAAVRVGERWRAFDPSGAVELDLGVLADGGDREHVNGFLRAWHARI